MKMLLSQIKISDAYANTSPRAEKMDACREHYLKNKSQDRYLIVSANNVLIDGYIQYLILKELGVEEAEVLRSSKKKTKTDKKFIPNHERETTYIYGIHNKHVPKEYVWRIPISQKNFADDLLPGDTVMVRTKYGLKPIIVTKIEVSSKKPVDLPIKKVYAKLK